jgi:virginiamycin A acetyltransferase
MVSLKWLVLNFLRTRKSANCSISVGRHTLYPTYIISAETADRVVIGNYCSISFGVVLIANHGHNMTTDYQDYRVSTFTIAGIGKNRFKPSYYLPEKRNFIHVGSDVLIGTYAIILPGITIGDGAVIGAGSVVTHNVPPYAVVAGVPAKILRYRYSKEQIGQLLKIAWWNWDEKKILDNMDYFYGKVEDFINKFYPEVETPKSQAIPA